MPDLPPPTRGDLPAPTGPDRRDPAAQYADRALGWVGRRQVAVKTLAWVLLWWVLAPLVIVRRTDGSGGGMIAALASMLVGLAIVVAPFVEDPPVAEPTAAAVDETAVAPSVDDPAPAGTPAPPPSPTPSPSPSPSSSPPPAPRPSPSPSEERPTASPRGDDASVVLQGRVVDVVDGDTIDLADGTRVRIAIADTPEVHGGIEPCGPEASDLTGSFLAGETVAVYRPDGAPATDGYGRTVGEVVRVTDGASLNVVLVAAGLARIDERFASEDPDLAARLRAAAASAETPDCTAQPDPQPESAPRPEPAAEPEPAGEPEPTGGGGVGHTGNVDGGYPCHPAYRECLPQVGDLDCGDVGHSVTVFDPSDDPYRLDGNDDDGRGCESSSPWSPSGSYPYDN